jgi:N utilization substance protein B
MTVQRRAARDLAFQALFEMESRPGSRLEDVLRERADSIQEETGRNLSHESVAFAGSLVHGTLHHRTEIDGRIGDIAPTFPVESLSTVDRVVLEMASYELLEARDAPVQVIINEAVELAKTYGGENSGRFVNGVLGTIAEEMPGNGHSSQRSDTSRRRQKSRPSGR